MAHAGRTFRIFISSTFSDLKEERNALQQYVFPRLRDLCHQHGCRFQAMDLRWGVSDEAGLDQQTMQICLEQNLRSSSDPLQSRQWARWPGEDELALVLALRVFAVEALALYQ